MSTQSNSAGSDLILRNQTFMSHVSVGGSPTLEAPSLNTVKQFTKPLLCNEFLKITLQEKLNL